jgi:hypothetical protein
MALRVAHGSYVGNGSDSRNITVSPSFAIKAVFIKADSTEAGPIVSFSGMGDKSRKMFIESQGLLTDHIQSMGTGTFQIGTDSEVNGNGITYYYFVIGGDDTEVLAGSYSGNDADDRQITTNFLPELVILIPNAIDISTAKFGATGNELTIVLSGAGTTAGTNFIQSFNSTGFVVGSNTAVNGSGITFYYLAVKAVSSQTQTSSYAGDDADNRNITSVGFQPDIVFIKGSAAYGSFRTASHTGDSTSRFSNTANASNVIQSFISTGFQIGTDTYVNAGGTTFYYYAIRDFTGSASLSPSSSSSASLSPSASSSASLSPSSSSSASRSPSASLSPSSSSSVSLSPSASLSPSSSASATASSSLSPSASRSPSSSSSASQSPSASLSPSSSASLSASASLSPSSSASASVSASPSAPTWTNQGRNSTVWSKQSRNSASWSKQNRNSANWDNQDITYV